MSGLATAVMRGEEAFLVASQARKLASTEAHELYQLNTAQCRLGVWDVATRSLVVFDTPALVALALAEAAEARHRRVDDSGLQATVIDPPSRL